MNEIVEKFKESIDGQPKRNKTLEEFKQALNCQPSRNNFYHGDCLFVLKHDITPESVDLIYLDPPFYTGKIQKGKKKWQPGAMEITFEDSRKFWAKKGVSKFAPEWMKDIAKENKERAAFASYLYYMMQRLQACHKVLKKTGSIYLHCDYRASHYLKMVMDEIFGLKNFQNEIIWCYAGGGVPKKAFPRKHGVILFYSKTSSPFRTFNTQFKEYGSMGQGKTWKRYDGSSLLETGKHMEDWWDDIRPVIPLLSKLHKTKEAVGYPTQKPEKLLKRIILASSNENDTVLDPFCGCGTAMVVSHKLNRRWIGIDIKKTAYEVTKGREVQMPLGMKEDFAKANYISRDLEEVQQMTGSEFQNWVNEYYKADRPWPDRGVDGITPDGIPIQSKHWKTPVGGREVSKFYDDAKRHHKIRGKLKEIMEISLKGYIESGDNPANQIKDEIEKEGVKVQLLTPEDMLPKL